MDRIAVIGAGAWGTALADLACRAGRSVSLWAREAEVVESVNRDHCNSLFLPDISLCEGIEASTDLAMVADADVVLLVVPSPFLRTVCGDLAAHWRAGVPAIVCAKGIEQGSNRLMTEIVAETLPGAVPGVLSGPTFAREVAMGLPTAVTLAMADRDAARTLRDKLAAPHFRIYPSTDVTGAEIGGAVKNVLAIGCGVVRGRGLGDNARAALITRGLAEIIRLGAALGARPETFMGLSGLGDLTLTCNAMQSRNFSFGVAIGQGRSMEDILAERRAVTEGVHNAASVVSLAEQKDVDMPICRAVDALLNHGAEPGAIIEGLLERPLRDTE